MDNDWIERFLHYTDGVTSPDVFRLWAGITAVSGALERRVWAETSRAQLFPNLFTLLVGPPGSGKTQAVDPVERLWRDAKCFQIAPNNVTKAALIDALAAAGNHKLAGEGLIEYHSLLVASAEFGVLIPSHDLEFLSVVNYIYDNPPVYLEERRTNKLKLEVTHPQLIILGGSQPGFLSYLLPEQAWTMGFAARMIMVYAEKPPLVGLFDKPESRQSMHTSLAAGLTEMGGLTGAFKWERIAQEELSRWHFAGGPPVPRHSRLVHYITRRTLHFIKLSMISSASRGLSLVITLEDVTRARDWLLGAELKMPDIFRAMVQKSDNEILQDYHAFITGLYTASKGKPILKSTAKGYLSKLVTSERVHSIFDLAHEINLVVQVAGTDSVVPKPKYEHNPE